MKQFLSPAVFNAICSPFRAQLNLALQGITSSGQGSGYAQSIKCTLGASLNVSATNFGSALKKASWEDYMSITQNPENNIHGAFLMSQAELIRQQSNALSNAKTESISNQGFLSQKKCAKYEWDDWTGSKWCVKWTTTSPGKWIQTQLSSATGIDFQEIALADEIDEIISALLSSFLSELLQGGIDDTTLPPPYQPPSSNRATLTVHIIGDGSVTAQPQKVYYKINPPDTVTLTAVPGTTAFFGGWSGDLSGANTAETLTMDSDKVVTATFTKTPIIIPPTGDNYDSEVLGSIKLTQAVSGKNYYGYYCSQCVENNTYSGCDTSGTSFTVPMGQQFWFLVEPNPANSNVKIFFRDCFPNASYAIKIYILDQNNDKITTISTNPEIISFQAGQIMQWDSGTHTDDRKYLVSVTGGYGQSARQKNYLSIYWSY